MKRWTAGAALVVALLMPMQAWAECAWVLWVGRDPAPATAREGFPTQKECEAARDLEVVMRAKTDRPALECRPMANVSEKTCAWVLWRAVVVSLPRPKQTAFRTQEECESARDAANRTLARADERPFACIVVNLTAEEAKARTRPPIWSLWRNPVAITRSPMDTFKTHEECRRRRTVMREATPAEKADFRCLPDTIDPRGSKEIVR
jgi:hypothetical protein